MHIIVFTHPQSLNSLSMPRFANMIKEGMEARGHRVEMWTSTAFFGRLPFGVRLQKWLGYIDQFIVFPLQLRLRLKQLPADTLFVFSDQALGPWVPLVAKRPHVIHVHDFMALRSSLGEFPQNPTSWTGKQYQALIRRGFGRGNTFISVSEKTRADLQGFLPVKPSTSAVVYNGLNATFRKMARENYFPMLASINHAVPPNGFLLHIGGNQWYKNRLGVLEIYEAYVQQVAAPLPLWMLGAHPSADMIQVRDRIMHNTSMHHNIRPEIHFISGMTDEQVCATYSAARLMIFPSIAEGFGWPIAEAMTCGCPVLTTNEAPMTEVGGDAAFYIPRRPLSELGEWALSAAKVVTTILDLSADALRHRQELGFSQVARFDANRTMDDYQTIYQDAIQASKAVQ